MYLEKVDDGVTTDAKVQVYTSTFYYFLFSVWSGVWQEQSHWGFTVHIHDRSPGWSVGVWADGWQVTYVIGNADAWRLAAGMGEFMFEKQLFIVIVFA